MCPDLKKSLLAEAARKEMERASPVPLNTLYISWQEVQVSKIDSYLCLLGLPRDNVDSVRDTVTLAGLNLKMLELKPLAVSRVIDDPNAIVVNVQEAGFDITIVQEGIPYLMRSLTFPQADMPQDERNAVIKEELVRTVNFYNSSGVVRRLGSTSKCYFSGQVQGNLMQDTGFIAKELPLFVFISGRNRCPEICSQYRPYDGRQKSHICSRRWQSMLSLYSPCKSSSKTEYCAVYGFDTRSAGNNGGVCHEQSCSQRDNGSPSAHNYAD